MDNESRDKIRDRIAFFDEQQMIYLYYNMLKVYGTINHVIIQHKL